VSRFARLKPIFLDACVIRLFPENISRIKPLHHAMRALARGVVWLFGLSALAVAAQNDSTRGGVCEDPNLRTAQAGAANLRTPSPLRLLKGSPNTKEVTTLTSDTSRGEAEKFLEATGNVEVRSPTRELLSDYVYYDVGLDTFRAKGNVSLRSWQDLVTGPELEFKRDTETGFMKSPKFVLGLYKGRGAADELLFTGPDQYRVIRGTYSTCTDANPAWRLDVGTLDVNEQTGVGTAKDAKVYVGGIPIAWLPQFTFPLKNERKSGFLAPTYGTSEARGFEFQVPYYLNLAPNYDATITPRIMTKRGVLVNGEFRYIVATPFGAGMGNWVGEYLPDDRIAARSRQALNLSHTQAFSPNLTLQLAFNRVSDPRYFVDLADFVSITSITTLPREAALTYRNFGWTFAARAQKFQTLQDPAAFTLPPYDRVPQLSAESPIYKLGRDQRFEVQTTSDATRFDYPNASNPSGYRAFNYTTLAYRYQKPGFFVTPRVSLHTTRYKLIGEFDDVKDSTRVVPITSLDAGLYFDRDTSLFGQSFRQSLEPRMMYTKIPFRDQSETPVFDTALADFNYLQLFNENRYIGNDRIGDTSQLTLGITSRLFDADSQKERLRFTLGNRIYFEPQRVTLNNELPRERNASDLLLSAQGRVTDNLYLESNLQYNANEGRNERLSFGMRYSPDRTRTLNLNYRSIRELAVSSGSPVKVKQVDASAQWPIYRSIYGVGRVNYSLADRRLTEGVIGIEYDGCCYVVRAVAQRLATSSTTATTAFFIQLELNGLARIGASPLDILKRNIPGYSVLYENPTRRRVDNSDTPTFTRWNPN
jgi:LPS-assembly protein